MLLCYIAKNFCERRKIFVLSAAGYVLETMSFEEAMRRAVLFGIALGTEHMLHSLYRSFSKYFRIRSVARRQCSFAPRCVHHT